jgi:hypothetical protein
MAILDWTWPFLDWTLLLLAAGAILYLWGTSTFGRFTKPNIPHAKPLPFIGSMASAFLGKQTLLEIFMGCYNQFEGYQYGVIFMFRKPVIFLTDLELIKAVAVKDFEYFTDRRTDYMESKESLWSKPLVILKGEQTTFQASKMSLEAGGELL